jgi:putative ABC transport system ATP-binding protein
MTTSIISVTDLYKVYKLGAVEVQALCGVSFEIKRGEFVAIIGHSGSGKSTLMNLLGCLDTPTSGTYRLDGVEVHSLSADELAMTRATRLGFVFQQYNLLPRQTALRNVEMPMIYRGVPGARRHQRATAALKLLGMAEPDVAAYANRILTLSDGQLVGDAPPVRPTVAAAQATARVQ